MTPRRPLRSAFTLLELVIVLMILAALAGLVIAQVAQLGRTTDMAFTAKTQADVAANLQTYFVLNKRYPTHMDSLLVSDGTTQSGVYEPELDANNNQRTGLPDSGPHLDEALVLTTPTAGQWRSFTRCGFDVVMDHSRSVVNSNQSGVFERPLSSSTPAPLATVTDSTAAGRSLLAQLFPKQVEPGVDGVVGTDDDVVTLPPNVTVVALGLGPRSSCIPDTMLNAPLYPGCDGTYYGHYVAFFACYESGERANLVGVSDSYGRLPNYSIQQFNESLPNNQRRG